MQFLEKSAVKSVENAGKSVFNGQICLTYLGPRSYTTSVRQAAENIFLGTLSFLKLALGWSNCSFTCIPKA